MRYTKQSPVKNEDGLVALFVVGIMIILLTLTTVAFTKLMGRESGQAVDRALSTQAYYAAQSGINDAKDYINAHPGQGLPPSANPCNTLATLGYPPYLGPAGTVAANIDKVTCVVADTTPPQLTYVIQPGQSQIFQISSSTGDILGSTLFSWDNASAPVTPYDSTDYKPSGATGFTDTNSWKNNGSSNTVAPVLEVSYYPIYPAPNTADLPTQISRSRTVYLYPANWPVNGYVNANYIYNNGGGPDGLILNKSCQSSNNVQSSFQGATNVYHCNAMFSFSGAIGAPRPIQAFVKVTSFYTPAKLIVMQLKGPSNDGIVNLKNAQVVLDSTGKGGSDVLKRLQTVIDHSFNDIQPNDSIESVLGICKRLEYNLTTGNAQLDDSVKPMPDDTNAACHTTDLN